MNISLHPVQPVPPTRQGAPAARGADDAFAHDTATILVVDDEPLARQMFTDVLEAQGFRVLTAAIGEEAFPQLADADLVLLDAMLPGRDGWSICREIKERIDPLLPVIMVTARTAPDDVVRTFDAGADDYVAKPFHVAELTARIGSRLRVHRSEMALQRAREQASELAERNYHLYEQARRDAEERALLLRELDHRVRNNLAVIMGLVGLERNRRPLRAPAEALATLETRLRAFIVVHEALRRQNYADVPVREITERLGQRLRAHLDPDGRVQLRITGDSPDLNERQAFGFALVANELLSNAMKHAFPGEGAGEIAVNISCEEDRVTLDVRDDGVGWAPAAAGAELGSGRSVIDAVVRGELGGSIEYPPAERGSHARVTFPRRD